jgi:hypothetical protein
MHEGSSTAGAPPSNSSSVDAQTTFRSEESEWICAAETLRRFRISRDKLLRAIDAGAISAITRRCPRYQMVLVHAESAEQLFGSDGPARSGKRWRASMPTARILSSEIEAT